MVAAVSHTGDTSGCCASDLVKAGETPEPVLTKEAGFIDPILEEMTGYIISVYDRWLKELPRRVTTLDLSDRIRRGHRVLARRVVSPAVEHAFDAGRVGAWRQDIEILKAVRGSGEGQLDLFIPTEPKKLKADIKKLDKEVTALEREHPLKPWDRFALEHAERRAAIYVRGLGNRIAINLETLEIETEHDIRRNLMLRIRREVSDAIVRRDTARQLASAIGRQTGDWSRNLDRIARTELQEAHQYGWAAHFRSTTGNDTLVAKRVDDGACDDCRRLYLEPDGKPKIFALDEIEANGTNVGLKRSQWKAVVGTVHPYCHCQLIRVPAGFGFDDEGRMVPHGGLT